MRNLYLILLLLGFALNWASSFTSAYSRRWGDRGGQLASSVLRNILGIPLWIAGLVLAWLERTEMLFIPGTITQTLGWLLIVIGFVPVIWGHLVLGLRTHMPSVRDTLVRHGLYAHVRHPIYGGGLLIFVGITLLRPTFEVILACAAGIIWAIVQARLEEIDLLQRLPAYREYMEQVPRFVPRLGRRQS